MSKIKKPKNVEVAFEINFKILKFSITIKW
ncbi:hypothetical protein FEFB_16400 [Fructobacillus sp. EFB-N1]|nr:hypothetical protein FEFB_16400 [Fructobacillus sp. EFB-N1]